MIVVFRKFLEHKNWDICGVFANQEFADTEIAKQIKSGREARSFGATHVWIAENGNHSWSA